MEKRKVEYTKKLHAHRLGLMLGKQNPCRLCPVAPHFSAYYNKSLWSNTHQEVHKVCMEFVGVPTDKGVCCPCSFFGPEKAIKKSIKALKDYYA